MIGGAVDSAAAYRLFVGLFAWAIIRGTLLNYVSWRRRQFVIPNGLRIFEQAAVAAFIMNAAFILAFVVWFVGATWGYWGA